jgi:type I restriction enzyme S subunit
MTVSLGEVAEMIMGQAPPGRECNKDGRGTIFVKAGEFNGRHLLVREWTTRPLKIAKSSDVLVCVVGATAGKVSASIDCAIGRSVAAVRPRPDKVCTDYLYHFLTTQTDALRAQSQGLAQGVITREMLREVLVPLPPLGEQRRIAAILDQADNLRQKRQESLRHLQNLGRIIFLEMFGDPIANTRQWKTSRLGDVGRLDRGVSKHRPRNDPILLRGRYPLIQTGDIANCDGYVRTYTATYSEQGLKQSKLWPTGTLCITIAANIGNTGILTFDACFPDSVVGFVPGANVLTEFIQQWFSFVQPGLEKDAPQFAQKNINLAILRALEIPIPPLEMQQAFVASVAEIDKLKGYYDTHLAKLDALFASLQHRAFRGEL